MFPDAVKSAIVRATFKIRAQACALKFNSAIVIFNNSFVASSNAQNVFNSFGPILALHDIFGLVANRFCWHCCAAVIPGRGFPATFNRLLGLWPVH